MEFSTRALLTIGISVVAVGLIDTLVTRSWDLLVVLTLVGGVFVALLLRASTGRVPVELRPDLAEWIEHRAERIGEPFDDVLDRAVGAYRAGMFDDR